MARNAGLALPEDLGQLADRELAPRAQDDEPKPGRLGNCAQCSQQMLHRQQDIEISLYVQADYAIRGVSLPLALAHSANFPQLSRPSPKSPIDARPTNECSPASPRLI